MKNIRRFLNVWHYAVREHLLQLLATFLIAVIIFLVIYLNTGNSGQQAPWINGFDLWSGMVTFLVAMVVWHLTVLREYRDRLPKRLNVEFVYEGRRVFRCEDAYLAGEGDIRAWALQIGQQMNNNERLNFDPDIQQSGPIEATRGGTSFLSYEVSFNLVKRPEFDHADETPAGELPKSSENGYWLWVIESDPAKPDRIHKKFLYH